MIEFSISAEISGAEALFKDIEGWGGKGAAQNIREHTGLLGRVCAERTQPVVDESGSAITATSQSFSGLSPAAKKMGQAAVGLDISRVYKSLTSIYKEIRDASSNKEARQFYAMIKAGQYDKAETFLRNLRIRVSSLQVGSFDGGARHKQMRNARGRVNKSVAATVVGEVDSLKAYIKEVKARVGYAKSGWINAARQIPGAKGVTRGVPAWVKNQRGPGYAIDGTRTDRDPYVQLINAVPYVSQIFGGRQQSNALRGFDELLIKSLRGQLTYLRQKHRHLLAA